MSDFGNIYEWLIENCKPLHDLLAVSSLLDDGVSIIQPNSSQNMYNVSCEPYTDGGKKYTFIPCEPYYFDVDIICYRACYEEQNADNIDAFDSVQDVCDWVIEQQNNGIVPALSTGCYQIECLTPKPFIRGVYNWNGSPGGYLADYAVTVRFYTANPAKRRVVVR